MSEYLRKRNRSATKSNSNSQWGKKNFDKNFKTGGNKNFAIKFSKKPRDNEYTVSENSTEDFVSDNLIKIGKFWDSKNLIEPKNTQGTLQFIEKYNNTNENYTLSIVGDSLHILDTNEFSIKKIIKHPEEEIISFVYNEPKREIICCMGNSLVRIFDIETTKCVKVWKLNKIVAKMMKIDPSFKFFAIVGSNHSILIYDLNNYNMINSFSGHDNFIYDIAFNPDKEKYILYSGSEDGSVKIWDIVLNKNIGVLNGHSNGVRHILLTNDGRSLISITTDNNICVWKLSSQGTNHTLLKTIPFYKSISSAIYFTRAVQAGNGKELVPSVLVGCEDGSLNEVNLKSGKYNENRSISFISQPIVQMFYSTIYNSIHCLTSDQVVATASINLVNDDISKASLSNVYPGYCQEILDVKFLPVKTGDETSNSVRYLFSSNDNTLKYSSVDKNGKANVKIMQGHDDFIMSISIKNNFISTTSKDGTIKVWQWELVNNSEDDKGSECKNEEFVCKSIAVLKGHSEAVNSSSLILKKGEFKLVSGSKDKSIKLWDFASAIKEAEDSSEEHVINESIYSQMEHNDEINLVKVSPNEKLIASGSYDKTIKIWNTQLKVLGTISGHKRAITDLSFSNYAKVLASCSTDKTIKIWNLNDYSLINTFEGHISSVLRIQWVYFGTHIISAGADGLVKFWNLKTSECLNTINAHEGKIWALDVLDETGKKNTSEEADGLEKRLNNFRFITGSTDSKITIWTDVTAQKETETLKSEEDKILKTERLRVLNDNKEYYDAMRLALDLNHKNYFMTILKNFVNENLKSEEESISNDQISIIINNRKYLDEHDLDVNTFGDLDNAKLYKEKLNKIVKDSEFRKIIKDNIDKVLEISRDNNIRASGFLYSQIILKLILVSTNFEEFVNKNYNKKIGSKNKAVKSLKVKKLPQTIDYIENFEIVKSYSQKHLERINRELTKSFLIDHVIEKMKII